MLQFACPYCNGLFQVDPSMAGGEAMCPLCHGLVAVPVDAFGPNLGGEPAVESLDDYDFRKPKGRGLFDGIDGGGNRSTSFDDIDAGPPQGSWDANPPPNSSPDPAAELLMPMACPHCGSGFQVDGSLAGQQAMCPTCHGVVMIPDANGAGFAPPPIPGPPMQSPAMNVPPPMPGFASPGVPSPVPGPSNPLPPGFSTPPLPASASASVSPLVPKSLHSSAPPSSSVPLSALQPASDSPSSPVDVTKSAPTKSDKPRPRIDEMLTGDARSSETSSKSTGGDKTRPVPISPLPPKHEASPSTIPTLRPKAPIPTTPVQTPPLSKSAKIDAMLPEQADPDEEVMAERPIAVEEPPAESFPPLVVDVQPHTPSPDPNRGYVRRPSAEERARTYRIRTLLLFGVGMLLLILAALVLPELGFVINVGDKPK